MLIAAIWQDHEDQQRVEAWLRGKQTATCPISELGFLRISSGDTFPFRADPQPCRAALSEFVRKYSCRFIPDDFSPRTVAARSSRQFTDFVPCRIGRKTSNEVGDARHPHFSSGCGACLLETSPRLRGQYDQSLLDERYALRTMRKAKSVSLQACFWRGFSFGSCCECRPP